MKLMTWALTLFTLMLLSQEQATARSYIAAAIITPEAYSNGDPYGWWLKTGTTYIYPGDYTPNSPSDKPLVYLWKWR